MQISDELNTIVAYAREEAMRTGSYDISPDHLCLAILRHSNNLACHILSSLGADLQDMKHLVEGGIMLERSIPYLQEDRVTLGYESNATLTEAFTQAARFKSDTVRSEHLLLALSKTDNTYCRAIMESYGIDFDIIDRHIPRKPKPEVKASSLRILGTISIKAPDIYS